LLLPKGTPAYLLDICRKAVMEMAKDPKFLAEAERDNPGAPHFTGEELARVYPAGVAGPPEVVQHIKRIYTEKYGVRFE
ncbi:MAG: hypothetical protein QME90_07470, partial [Thermodesulfobacteriota bacterium]|nr:hypothetical protein [Thermodesulfobacteriota bacterium]